MQCNPFEIDKLTAMNNTSVHFDDHVYQSISKIELNGKEQCLAFIKKPPCQSGSLDRYEN